MHLYFISRGIKHDVDRFINELSSVYLPFKHQAEGDKEIKSYMLQTSVRPIQIWEVAYPKEHHEMMCRTIFGETTMRTQYKGMNKYLYWLRKVLKIDKITDYKPQGDKLPLYNQNIDKIAIGTKQDRLFDNGTEAI